MRQKAFRSLLFALALVMVASAAFAGAVTDPIVNEPGTLPIVNEPLSLTVAMSQNATIVDYETNYETKYIEEKTGIDIVWQLYPSTDAVQKMNILVASGTALPDIIAVGKRDERNIYGTNGALIPLNEYMDTLAANFNACVERYGYDREWILNMCKHSDGNLYSVPYFRINPPDTMGWRQWINTAWLEKLGLAEPTTTDELVEVLRAFRDQDPNGNGQPDEIPLVGNTNGWNTNVFYFIQNMFIYYDSNENYHLIADDVLDVAYDKDEYREALRFAHMLYTEGLLSPLSFTQTSTEYAAMCSQETEIVGIGVCGSASPFSANRKDYEGVPCIMGPNGAQYATGSMSLPDTSAGISVDCAHPEAALRFLDAFYNDDEFILVDRWGEQGVDWDYPEAGQISAFEGVAPAITVLRDIWGQEQNSTWAYGFMPTISDDKGTPYTPVWDGDTTTGESKNARAIAKISAYIPDERVSRIVYTDDENSQWGEIRTTINTYLKESQARFITGDMDIEAGWEAYLNELTAMDYKGLLEMDQAAYNRTIGK